MSKRRGEVEDRSKAARAKAEKEYEDRWNLRPARNPPAGLLAALEAAAENMKGVRCLTLADAREDSAGIPHLRLGVFIERGAGLAFDEAAARFAQAVRPVMPRGQRLEVEQLDIEVRAISGDGDPNPYVIFSRSQTTQ